MVPARIVVVFGLFEEPVATSAAMVVVNHFGALCVLASHGRVVIVGIALLRWEPIHLGEEAPGKLQRVVVVPAYLLENGALKALIAGEDLVDFLPLYGEVHWALGTRHFTLLIKRVGKLAMRLVVVVRGRESAPECCVVCCVGGKF